MATTNNVGEPISVTLATEKDDIARARTGNRCQCVIARAIDRIYGLQGWGKVRVDANEISFIDENYRYHFHPDRRAVQMLREFDEIGAKESTKVARKLVKPGEFGMTFLKVRKVVQKKATNDPGVIAKRRQRAALARETLAAKRKAGTVHTRYTGV